MRIGACRDERCADIHLKSASTVWCISDDFVITYILHDSM